MQSSEASNQMTEIELAYLLENVRRAETLDLLDRATVYRAGMDADALVLIEAELARRGLGPADLEAHLAQRGPVLVDPLGVAYQCSRCRAPAVVRAWDWHRLWGKIPIFPRPFYFCSEHAKDPPS